MRFSILTVAVACGFGAALACARPSVPSKAVPVERPSPSSVAAKPPPLAPLTPHESELVAELESHVQKLSVEIGDRNTAAEWNLASATDYLAGVLEKKSITVERLGYSVGESVVQNLQVTVAGGAAADETVVVGAHYDTHPGSPGADDNASGCAALLTLIARFAEARPARTLRFVFFTNEEQPHFRTETMGSLVYAKALVVGRVEVVAMLSLDSLGYYSDAPASQRYPEGVGPGYPSIGNFVAVIGNPESKSLLSRVSGILSHVATLPVVSATLPERVSEAALSDHWAFWELDFPALLVTDTAPFRYADYHRATDLPKRLDFTRLARVVAGLEAVIAELGAAPVPS